MLSGSPKQCWFTWSNLSPDNASYCLIFIVFLDITILRISVVVAVPYRKQEIILHKQMRTWLVTNQIFTPRYHAMGKPGENPHQFPI